MLKLNSSFLRELNDFVLPIGLEHVPDVLVFGTQESCSERYEWEVSLQETLGPTHLLFHSTSLGNSFLNHRSPFLHYLYNIFQVQFIWQYSSVAI